MSDFQAIGGVSATLQALLRDRLEPPPGLDITRVHITLSTPRSDQETGQASEDPRINLFLYRVNENVQLKNQEIPGHGHPNAFGYPPLSLDLHYLITAYGSTPLPESDFVNETRAHYLLGSAMRVLHDFPVIAESLVTVREPSGQQILHESLRGEFEKIKLILDPLSLEDLTKVWTALTLPYRLSAAYLVSVVQIESQRPRVYPRLVREPPSAGPRVYAIPLRTPQITEILVRRPPGDPADMERPYPYARLGDTLIILGRHFAGTGTRVVLGAVEMPVTPRSDDRIEISVPDDTLPDSSVIPQEKRLQPGPQAAAVVVGVPDLPQTGFYSNRAAFMLVPRISTLLPQLSMAPRTLKIQGSRLFYDNLSGETLVGRALIPKASYAGPSPTEITVPLPDSLAAWPVVCLVSASLPASFTFSAPTPQVQVTIGGEGPHTATLPAGLTTPADAAGHLQAAIRSAHGSPAFRNTRVTLLDSRLIVTPGGLFGAVNVAPAADPHTFEELGFAGASMVQGYLSGELRPFPELSAGLPRMRVTLGASEQTIAFPARPASLEEAAARLDAALSAAFPGTWATTLENQLLILPGAPGDLIFEGLTEDETSVAELQLHVRYPVRVRVNGAESLDAVIAALALELP
jgi:hypothetical protein